MAPRRSQRFATSGSQLSNRICDVESQARAQALNDMRMARELKHENTKAKFQFTDLLPEIRNRIYAYAMDTDVPRALINAKTPVLALVSKQVRNEAMSVFFSKSTFLVHVASNYAHVNAIDSLAAQKSLNQPQEVRDMARASSLNAGAMWRLSKTQLSRFQKSAGIAIAFKNVDFIVSRDNVVLGNSFRARFRGMKEQSVFGLSTLTGRTAKVTNADGNVGAEYLAALSTMRNDAAAVAQQLVQSRARFIGFTIDDLDTIAKSFKYWPIEEPQQHQRWALWPRGQVVTQRSLCRTR
ncbi:hypothetical protein LTR08_005075 [Meristemomyces frigidus]|nr:hypothetical protein LTR08_005075 [Meristemomyces frigidus]